MALSPLRLCRSALFLPASNLRAIEKVRGLDADMVILDLEDSVKPEDKEQARANAVEALATGFQGKITALRVNDIGSDWYSADVIAARGSGADFVVLPMVESARAVLNTRSLAEKPVLAMIETAVGVQGVQSIAAETQALIVGANDLRASLDLPPGPNRSGMVHALQTVVIAARAAGIAVFDGVFNGLEDPDGLRAECEQGRAFGFDGKTLIHPNQIAAANTLFAPTPEQIDAAHRLIAASFGGAQRHEGVMVEAMHVDQARALIERVSAGRQAKSGRTDVQ